MKRLVVILLLIGIHIVFGDVQTVLASEMETDSLGKAEELLDLFDFSDVQEKIDADLGTTANIDFNEMIRQVITKGVSFDPKTLYDLLQSFFVSEIIANKNSIIQVLIISVLCALLTNLVGVFEQSKTAELAFCISYMCLIGFLLNSFYLTYALVKNLLQNVIDFMRTLLPAYMISFSYVGNAATTVAYHEIFLAVIAIVELIILKILLPMMLVYITLRLLNSLSKEPMLKRMAELIKTLISWGIKTITATVIGIQLLQNLLLPYIDRLKGTLLQRAVSALPGIGNSWSAFTDVVVGSGMLIKNAIGVSAILIIGLLCVAPIVKLTIITLMYLFAAAVTEPFSDERLIEGIDGLCEANKLLLKLLLSGVLLFVITIALLCATGTAIMR